MDTIKRMRPLLGTFVEIGVPKKGPLTEQQIQAAVNAAFLCIEEIQQQLSFHNVDSVLSRVNTNPLVWHEWPSTAIRCLKLARALGRITQGLFNCTLGKHIVVQGALPEPGPLTSTLEDRGTWEDIEIKTNRVRLRRPVWICLDGIAKGFAVDEAIKILQQRGVSSAWINAGGDIRIYGSAAIPISIRDHTGMEHAMGGLHNAAIATSTSIYSPETPGVLLSPLGEPLPAATWTVMAAQAWRADALTKVAANLPTAIRHDYLNRLGGRWIKLPEATFSKQQLSKYP